MKALHASKGRKSAQQFIAEGPAAVLAALSSKRHPVLSLYVTESGAELLPQSALTRATYLSEKVMAAISTVENAQGVLALCAIDSGTEQERSV